jgi:hypothetical protein
MYTCVYKKKRWLNKKKTANEIETFTAVNSSEIILAGESPA